MPARGGREPDQRGASGIVCHTHQLPCGSKRRVSGAPDRLGLFADPEAACLDTARYRVDPCTGVDTLRTRLLKLAAVVVYNTRRIRLYFASNWPNAPIFAQAMKALGAT
jgi:hypothetical protein